MCSTHNRKIDYFSYSIKLRILLVNTKVSRKTKEQVEKVTGVNICPKNPKPFPTPFKTLPQVRGSVRAGAHAPVNFELLVQCTLPKNTFLGYHPSCRFPKGAPAKLKSNILLINLDFYGLRTLCNIYNLKTNTLLGGKFLMKMCELDFLGGHFWGHSKNPSPKFENLKTFPTRGPT